MSEPKAMGKDALQHLFGDDDDSDTSGSDGEDVASCEDQREDAGEEQANIKEQANTKQQTGGNPFDGNTSTTCIAETRKRKSCLQPPGADCNTNDDHDHHDDNHEAALRSWNQKIGILDHVLTKDDCDELIALHSSQAHQGYMDHLQITRVADSVGKDSVNPLVLPLLRARYQVWEKVEELVPHLKLNIFPEYTAIASWHRGAVLQKHYDSNKEYLQDRHYSAVLYLNDPSSDNTDDNDDDDHSDEFNNSQQQQQEEEEEEEEGNHHPSNYHRCGFSGGDLVFEVPVFDEKRKKSKTATTTESPPATEETSATASIRRIKPKAGRLVCFPASDDYVHGVEEITRGTRYALTMWFTNDETAMEHLDSLQRAFAAGIFSKFFNAMGLSKNLPCSQQQPWETPQQQRALRQSMFETAGLFSFEKENQTENDYSIPSYTVTETELLHLIAYCWWKRGRPLGDYLMNATRVALKVGRSIDRDELDMEKVTIWGLYTKAGGATNDDDEDLFGTLYRDWKFDYLPKRWKGLKQSMERWMNDDGGLITNVKDSEMLLLEG